MFANRNRAWSASVCGCSDFDGRTLLRGGQGRRVHAGLGQHVLDPQGDDGLGDDLSDRLVRLLLEPDLAGAREVGRHDDDGIDATTGQRGVGARRVRERDDDDVTLELGGGRGQRAIEPGGRRLDDPDPGGLLVAEQQRRDDERAHDEQRGEEDRQDEAATSPALEDLASRHQPDAPPPAHRTPSGRRRRGNRFHEQLREPGWLVGEAPDRPGRLGPCQQLPEVDRLVDQEPDALAAPLDDGEGAVAIEPRAVGSGDLDVEVPSAGLLLEVLDSARSDDPAPRDDHDVLADVLYQVELVAGKDHPDPGPRALLDHLRHRPDADRVEAGERLVEDEQLGVMGEGDGQLDPLLVAVRQLFELRLGPIGQAHPLQPAHRGGIGVASRQAVLLGEVRELLADAHPRIQPALLRHISESEACRAIHRATLPADRAAVGAGQAEDAAHRRRLAGAVGSEEPDDAAGRGLERGAVEGHHGPVALGQIDDLEHRTSPATGSTGYRMDGNRPPDEPGACDRR